MKKLLVCFFTFSLTFLLSCENKLVDNGLIAFDQTNSLITEARQYFERNLSYTTVSGARKINKEIEWYKQKQPQWDKAVKIEVDGKEVVEVPLLLDGQNPVYSIDNPALGKKGQQSRKTV